MAKTYVDAGARPGISGSPPGGAHIDTPGDNLSPQCMQLRRALMMPEPLDHLLGETVVFVGAYVAHLSLAVAGSYLDDHGHAAGNLGAKVFLGEVDGNAASNSLFFCRQKVSQTRQEKSVVEAAHSRSSLACMDVLQGPAFARVHGHIDKSIAINDSCRNAPLAHLLRRNPILGHRLRNTIVVAKHLCGGDEDRRLENTQSRRLTTVQARQEDNLTMVERLTVAPVVSSYSFWGRLGDYAPMGILELQSNMAIWHRQKRGGAAARQSHVLPSAGMITLQTSRVAEFTDDLGCFGPAAMMQDLMGVCLQTLSPARRWHSIWAAILPVALLPAVLLISLTPEKSEL